MLEIPQGAHGYTSCWSGPAWIRNMFSLHRTRSWAPVVFLWTLLLSLGLHLHQGLSCVSVGHVDKEECHCPIPQVEAVQEPDLCHLHTGQLWGHHFAPVLFSDCSPSSVSRTWLQFVDFSIIVVSYCNSECVDDDRLLQLTQPGFLTRSWKTYSLPS